MRYGGFKHNIDRYRTLKQELDEVIGQNSVQWIMNNDQPRYQQVETLQRLITQCGTVTNWMLQLQWEGPQIMPSPFQELTFNQYMGLGDLGHESEHDAYYEGLNIPGEFAWFGGLSCHIRIYYSYALVAAHIAYNRDDSRVVKGQGIEVPATGMNCNRYWTRFFRIGCDHVFKDLPKESYMCYHASVCIKCGMRHDVDSSG